MPTARARVAAWAWMVELSRAIVAAAVVVLARVMAAMLVVERAVAAKEAVVRMAAMLVVERAVTARAAAVALASKGPRPKSKHILQQKQNCPPKRN